MTRSIVTLKFCLASIPDRYGALRTLAAKARESDRVFCNTESIQVLQNGQLVDITMLLGKLESVGFIIRSALQAPRYERGLNVTVVMSRPGVYLEGNPPVLTSNQELCVMDLFNNTWQYAHAWSHAELGSLVFIGIMNQRAQSKITLVDGKLFHESVGKEAATKQGELQKIAREFARR